jgi:hypothetical protein
MATEADEIKKKRSDASRKGYQRYTVHLEIEVVKAMKLYAAANKLKLVDLFNEALNDYLKQRAQVAPETRLPDNGKVAEVDGELLRGEIMTVVTDTQVGVHEKGEPQLAGVLGLLKRVWKK